MSQRRLSALAAILASAVAASPALAQTPQNTASAPAAPIPTPRSTAAPAPTPVIEWNRTLLAIVRTKVPTPLQPPTIHATRAFAILHLAIYDAVVAVDGGTPYLRERILAKPASAPAAADQAAHDVLVALYPSQQAALDNELTTDLARVSPGERLARAVTVGQTAAHAILANPAPDS